MHERKVEMARRAEVFFGLPGGFGTFEEVMEVSTWTQLGIHRKRKPFSLSHNIRRPHAPSIFPIPLHLPIFPSSPSLFDCQSPSPHQITHLSPAVILLNVLGYYDPLRQMIKNGIEAGFIQPYNESIILFVDGPADRAAHATFDWGKAALDAIDEWYTTHTARPLFNWVTKEDGKTVKITSDAMAFT